MPQLPETAMLAMTDDAATSGPLEAERISALLAKGDDREVWVLEPSLEIFDDYDLTGRSGLTFYEAWESEQKTNKSLEAFPEVWKAFILALVQHSTETADQIAQRAVEFTRGHYTVGEEVRLELDSNDSYLGRINMASYAQDAEGNDHSEYRVLLMKEADPSLVLGEAVFVGQPPFRRARAPLSKALVKRLIKSVATRLPFSGAPWVLKEAVAEAFALNRPLPPALQERYDAYKRRQRHDHDHGQTSDALASEPAEPTENDDVRYPVDDAEVEAELRAPDEARPPPTPYPGPLADCGLLSHALQHWTFLRAFASPNLLDLSPPFPFDDYVQALEWNDDPNPLMEAILASLLSFLARDRRNQSKAAFAEAVEEVLQLFPSVPEVEGGEEPVEVENPHAESPANRRLLNGPEDLVKVKWFEASGTAGRAPSTWRVLAAFVGELALLLPTAAALAPLRPLINHLQYQADLRRWGWRQLAEGVALPVRVALLDLVVGLAMRHRLVREHTDLQSEVAGEAKKVRRELEAERNRLQREADRLEEEVVRLQEEEAALRQDDASPSLAELRQASQSLRLKRNELGQLEKQLRSLSRRIEAQAKAYRTAMAFRTLPLGEDRHGRRYWWFDGPCTKPAEVAQQGLGRLMVCEVGGERWSFYERVDQLQQLQDWLSPLGRREVYLKAVLEMQQERLQLFLKPAPKVMAEAADDDEAGGDGGEATEHAMMEVEVEEEEIRPVGTRKRPGRKSSRVVMDGPAFLQYRANR